MNIKSLLFGSAAALVVASGAQAADAVVAAEPEPVDYVRVCDVYGAGFYYIPGTETCLKVSGYVRYDVGFGDGLAGQYNHGTQGVIDKGDAWAGVASTNDTYFQRSRAVLNLDARQDTEYGTLRAFVEARFNYDMGDVDNDGLTDTNNNYDLAMAYIELGGLRVGKNDSLFKTWTSSAGRVSDDSIVPFATSATHQIVYTFRQGAFSGAVGLESGSGEVYTIDSYLPHLLGAVAYDAGQFKLGAVAGYDSNYEEFAVKARLDVKATDTISAFLMGAWQSDENKPNFYGPWDGEWAVWGGFSAKVSPRALINAQLSYSSGIDYGLGHESVFAAVANVEFTVARNFYIRPEISYTKINNLPAGVDDDYFGGLIRFNYSFGG